MLVSLKVSQPSTHVFHDFHYMHLQDKCNASVIPRPDKNAWTNRDNAIWLACIDPLYQFPIEFFISLQF